MNNRNTGGNSIRVWTTDNGLIINHRRPIALVDDSYHIRTSDYGQSTTRIIYREENEDNDRVDVVAEDQNHFKEYEKVPETVTPLHNTFVGVQSRFRRKAYDKVLLVLAILAIILLLIILLLISLSMFIAPRDMVCHSKQCLRSAANLLFTMDENADPCENFYQFTCGRWGIEHPRPESVTSHDWFREKQIKIMRKLRQFLQQNISVAEPKAVGKAKLMYRACMDIKLMDELEILPLLKYLNKFELPILPMEFNFTLSERNLKNVNENREFIWLRSLVLIKKYMGMDLIIGFDIFPDPLNRTIKRIALGTPETGSVLPFNNDDIKKFFYKFKRTILYSSKDDEVENFQNSDELDDNSNKLESTKLNETTGVTAYVIYIKKLVAIYVAYLDPQANSDDVDQLASEIAINSLKLGRRIYQLKDEAENTTESLNNAIDDIIYLSVEELHKRTHKSINDQHHIIWSEYIQMMMKNNTNSSDNFNITDLQIITSHADILYLKAIVEYLEQVSQSDIQVFLWLSIVEELILHTTSELRLLHDEYMQTVTGIEGTSPRSLHCSHIVNTLMGIAVSYTLVDDRSAQDKLLKADRMLKDIQNAFNNLVRSITWMDEKTKTETLNKSYNMRSFIGYPEWIKNETALNEFYTGLTINSNTHLENMIQVLHWQMVQKLSNFNDPEFSVDWASTSPSNVNAFHTFHSNAITIPIAILQYPFFDLGLEALNYGSIGTILGHELTHGFDDNGRMFDKYGNMVQWWSNATINEYLNRTECFKQQYNRYYLPDVEKHINGELTLGENIADNGGMREAYYAYRLFVKRSNRQEEKLPGLEHYTHEQLFFISFGNLWCETYTPNAYRYVLEDSHCPGKIRLKGVLTNSEEFARAFKCSIGTSMNPKRSKCRIW